MAGLAASGRGHQAALLNDPITLIAIALAALVYGWLLHRGGRALAGRPHAWPVLLSVGATTAVLPFLPAAVRQLGAQAGWLTGFASIGAVSASILLLQPGRRRRGTIGAATARSNLWVIAFSTFSMLVVIGYTTLLVRGFGPEALLPIAIATIPAMTALAAAATRLQRSARRATDSMVSLIVAIVLTGVTWIIMPPAMRAASWLWIWAATYSATAIVVGLMSRQAPWVALSTVPLGLATLLSSPTWLGDHTWGSVALWRRVIGGEPLLAAAMITPVTAIVWRCTRDEAIRRWLRQMTAAWGTMATLIAAMLAVSPPSALGIAPAWTVPCVLLISATATCLLSLSNTRLAAISVGIVAFAWISIFRPFSWGPAIAAPSSWLATLVAVSASLLLMRAFALRQPFIQWSKRRETLHSISTWDRAAAILCWAAMIGAILFASTDWASSAWSIAAVIALQVISASQTRSIVRWREAQFATLLLATVVGYGRFHESLYSASAWFEGTAFWAWALLFALVAAGWTLFQDFIGSFILENWRSKRRLSRMLSRDREPSPEHWFVTVAALLSGLASIQGFVALLSNTTPLLGQIESYEGLILPFATFCIASVSLARAIVRRNPAFLSDIGSLLTIAGVIWLTVVFSTKLTIAPSTQLIVAASGAVLLMLLGRRAFATRIKGQATAQRASIAWTTAPIVIVATSSAGLLHTGWIEPVARGNLAVPIPTLAVCGWWLGAASILLVRAKAVGSQLAASASALLAPAATALVVPVFFTTSFVVWIQVAAIGTSVWMAVAWCWSPQKRSMLEPAMNGSRWFAVSVGVLSALAVTAGIILNEARLFPPFGPASLACSTCAAMLLWLGRCERGDRHGLPWPISVSMLGGQIGWLIYVAGWAGGVQVIESLCVVWTVGGAASMLIDRTHQRPANLLHIIATCVCVTGLTAFVGLRSTSLPWMSLAVLSVGGFQVAFGTGNGAAIWRRASRVLGWFVVAAGGWIVAQRLAAGTDPGTVWTAFVIWATAWLVVWRVAATEFQIFPGPGDVPRLAAPDMELSILLMAAVIGESALVALGGVRTPLATGIGDTLLGLRVGAYLVACVTTLCRPERTLAWTSAAGTLVAVVSLISAQTTLQFGSPYEIRIAVSVVAMGFVIALGSHWLSSLSRQLARWRGDSQDRYLRRLTSSLWRVTICVTLLSVLAAAVMIAEMSAAGATHLTIVSVALCAWAIAMMAETINRQVLRYVAVGVGLAALALWASVDTGSSPQIWLTASMRWFVATVFAIPFLMYVIPALIGPPMAQRWESALRRGAIASSVVSCVCLIVMLGIEALVRDADGIAELRLSTVLGVAVTLAILSVIATATAIASGPAFSMRHRFGLQDGQRRSLIVAAQLLGGITWLHLYLCQPEWAFVGLRTHWPYVVMALSFATAALTELARRMRDGVLADTLTHTALYLPLIPVIGFWLTGFDSIDWLFPGGTVRYEVLLSLGAAYYLAVAFRWKTAFARIACVVMGNAAWWIVLVQWPGWGFLSHPQVWMIPPAVCVLVVAQLYRERLPRQVLAAVRYGSTLVIYISSTADILVQQIGTNLWGPIILIGLALSGMGLGVLLRIRPFLYLGATFVFLGVTSMVWHAHLAFESVWPWWVFGISTGLALLAGLMAIEKNRTQLRRYAAALESWS